MAARTSLADLITEVRSLVADPYGATFTDDQVQTALDARRTERRWVPLRPVQSFVPGGGIYFYDFYSDAAYWEADVQLQDMSYTTITADLSELFVGHWHFNVQPQGIGVRATGKTFDVHGSAADLLDRWAAQVMLDFDFTSNADQYRRSQKHAQIVKMAAEQRKLALPLNVRLVQSDAMPEQSGSGITYPAIQGDGFSYGP